MTLLKIARMGHPVLRRVAEEVPADQIHTPAFQHLVEAMIATMVDGAGIGLAAPQIHHARRLVVLGDPQAAPDAPHTIPLTVLINPVWEARSQDQEHGWEGCLSIPGLRGWVPRARQVTVRALDRRGEPFRLQVEGYFARVVQHEIDHLDGVLFLDRMDDLRPLAYEQEFARYWAPEPEAGDPASHPDPDETSSPEERTNSS